MFFISKLTYVYQGHELKIFQMGANMNTFGSFYLPQSHFPCGKAYGISTWCSKPLAEPLLSFKPMFVELLSLGHLEKVSL